MWIRTKSISCQEFFHGMQEIIVEDTPVTLFMGEDEQRPLAERVAKFLPRVNANYTIIDTKEHELKGISPEFRGTISHLVMHGVNNRVDAYCPISRFVMVNHRLYGFHHRHRMVRLENITPHIHTRVMTPTY